MCGISGIYNLDGRHVDREELDTFRDSLKHRGPDGKGSFIKKNIGIAHRRLSIIDLSESGNQPMFYGNRYVITYNGECYNYEEIRSELRNNGYKFKSNTDTEVILAGYDFWGEEIQNKLNGMWAFAIYDLKKNELFLSRDRFGIKPLFYLKNTNYICFASELKAFMFLGENKKPSFDDHVLLNLRLYDSNEKTFLKNVFSLPAGHSIKITKNNFLKKNWWKIENSLININKNEIHEQFYDLFLDSLKKTLVSDVKIAFSLSGGLDSSSLALASNQINLENEKLNISHDFKNFFSLKYKNHQKYDDIVLDHLKKSLNVKTFEIDNQHLNFEKIIKNIYYFESVEESAVGPFELYKNIRDQGFKVSIDGHGPDEMLGGYDTYIMNSLIDSFFNVERFKNINILSKKISSKDLSMNRVNLTLFLIKKLIKKLINFKEKNFSFETNKELFNFPSNFKKLKKQNKFKAISFLDNKLLNDFHYGSLPDILRKFDRISMSNSIESRVPYLDYRLVSFCFSIPSEYKINENTKQILRNSALKNLNIPNLLYERTKKEGFVSPPEWYVKNMTKFINETINSSDFKEIVPFCNNKNLKEFVKKPNYSKLKKAFSFCQVYFLKKTFKKLINV